MMTSPKTVPEPLLQRLRQGTRFLLTSHVSPDGDSIGSALALARILRSLGKGALVWNRDPAPSLYLPIPGCQRIHVGSEPPAGFPDAFNAAIILECPALERTGLEDLLGALPLINIDHHLGNQHYAALNWVDPSAPAVGEMVGRLAHGLKASLDDETATTLLLTLVTDTGGFRFTNATSEAFEAAAALVREGARPDLVSLWLYESQPEPVVRLLGELLRTLELHHGGRIATTHLTPEMYERVGAGPGDSEGLIDYPRSIAGVEAVALFRQLDGGSWKVSLRSRGETDVEKIARNLGGGGHRNAAGCTLSGELAAVQAQVREALVSALD